MLLAHVCIWCPPFIHSFSYPNNASRPNGSSLHAFVFTINRHQVGFYCFATVTLLQRSTYKSTHTLPLLPLRLCNGM